MDGFLLGGGGSSPCHREELWMSPFETVRTSLELEAYVFYILYYFTVKIMQSDLTQQLK